MRILTNKDHTYNNCGTCDAILNCTTPHSCGPATTANSLPSCTCPAAFFAPPVNITYLADDKGTPAQATYGGACRSCKSAFNCTTCDPSGCLACPRSRPFHVKRWDGGWGRFVRTCEACGGNCTQCYTSGDMAGQCTACVCGFYLSSTGTCTPCAVPGCAQCNTDGARGFYLGATGCAPCPQTNCLACTSDGTACIECANRNEVVNRTSGACAPCSSVVPHCRVCRRRTGACAACERGYFWNATTVACTACSGPWGAGCAQCTAKTCGRCSTGLHPAHATDIPNWRHRSAFKCLCCADHFWPMCAVCTSRRCFRNTTTTAKAIQAAQRGF